MSSDVIIDILQGWLCFIVVLTFHEAAHAWAAWKLGDDTARLLGRISLNPLVHMEFFGTVVLPLLARFLSASGSALGGFIIGWGKPVPFNPANLKNRAFDGMLIALAGPAMNVLVSICALVLAKLFIVAGWPPPAEMLIYLAYISMVLCFFNLIPIPPLDGSHVLRYLLGIGEEAYASMAQFGIIILILLLNFTPVGSWVGWATNQTMHLLGSIVGLPI
jgi:Zn-dependent protease